LVAAQGRGRRRADELLEDADVENIMEAGAGRELQLNSNVVDDLLDAVRTNEVQLKLVGRGTGQGRRCPLPEAECPVADLVVHRPMVLVVHTLLDRLRLFEAIANIVEECSTFLHLLSNSCHARLAGLIRADSQRVAAIDHAERCLLERRLEGGVCRCTQTTEASVANARGDHVGDMPKSPSSQYGLKAQEDIDPRGIRVTNGPMR
jgi:hypothetical protein